MSMELKVPQNIIDGLNEILNKIAEDKKLKGYKFLIGNPENVHMKDFDDSTWEFSDEPVKYQRHQGTTWFRFGVKISEHQSGIPVAGSGVRLSSFFLAPVDIYVDGELKLSERTWVDFKVPEVYLTKDAVPGQVFNVAVKFEFGEYCYYPGQFSMNMAADSVEDAEFEINSIKEELAYACRFGEVTHILPDVFKLIGGALESKVSTPVLLEKIRFSREMLRPMEASAKEKTVHLIGHAHIDMNWFWSIDETHDLVRRDFGTMVGIMEEQPDFKFSQSQCATYEMAERLYPDIFEKMKKFIKSGNWDVTASAWVEGDVNMASGEAIARHILYSKKYLKEKFGVEPRIMWDPDTFGHPANLPQIAKKGGIDYYFFMRCGKSGPVFWWEGLDGSRLLAYNMLYGSDMNTASALDISKQLEDSCGLKNSMYVYGTGDHGGGPTRRDIRRARQLNGYPTMPRLEFSTTHTFYDSVVKENVPNIPMVKGELNFVFDGCYTTHADIKKYNRLCENMLVSTEALGAAAGLFGFEYDGADIENCWKTALFNQFHDIFDGSGVKATYTYSAEIAEKALETLSKIRENSIKGIASKIGASKKGAPFILFNTTGWERSEYVKIKLCSEGKEYCGAVDADGNVLPAQLTGEGITVFVQGIPSMGYKVIYLTKEQYNPAFGKIKESDEFYEIETVYYKIEIKKNSGEITTLFDKKNDKYIAKREQIGWKLRNGILNTLQVHYEVPTPMSGWTIGAIDRVKCLVSGAKSAIKEDGPEVKVISFEHKVNSSLIKQEIVVYNNSPRIDFVTHVCWNESGGPEKEAPMLKACFAPEIENRHATYEIPYGAIDRPCKDMEVPALKWMDISDETYGFSVLNDCKYGHKVKGNAMELTLLRSGWEPDPVSDIGEHDFTYSILPHKGSWKESTTIQEGNFLNSGILVAPVEIAGNGGLPEALSFINIDKSNVVISAFKPAESGDAYIIRVYEGTGSESGVKANLGFEINRIEEVDLNESKVYGLLKAVGRSFEFNIKPFEIKTFKLYTR